MNVLTKTTVRFRRSRRHGNILVLSAVLMAVTGGFVAFAVELGMLYLARTELQRAADAAALSAAWDLVDEAALTNNSNFVTLKSTARTRAAQYAGWNTVLSQSLYVPTNDIAIGYIPDPTNPAGTVDFASSSAPNAVQVTLRRATGVNQPVSFGFARLLGFFQEDVEAVATAAMVTNSDGFRAPADGGNLGILPIALDEPSWNALLAGGGTDQWAWDETTKTITPGSDGIKELNLFPQGTGSPGNRGTVDIGSNNNSTADLSRQITEGLRPSDLNHHGGELKFNAEGKLYLNGDTGISAGIKDDLASIKGQPRTIPIFTQVVGPGNNATYTIVKFVGIRILDVKLTGSQSGKRVTVQPATIVARGLIPTTTTGKSKFVYSPPWLIR